MSIYSMTKYDYFRYESDTGYMQNSEILLDVTLLTTGLLSLALLTSYLGRLASGLC